MLDVRNEDEVRKTVDNIMAEHGRIDVLINNAGTDTTLSIEDLSVADWDRVLDVNLRGPFLLSKGVYPLMKRQGKGHIVNITSTAAKRVWTEATAYHASKWGLLGFSHALHAEGRRDNIKVTAVVVGGDATPFIMDRFRIPIRMFSGPQECSRNSTICPHAARRDGDSGGNGAAHEGDIVAVACMAQERAVFIDKDGTLIQDVPYNVDPANVRLTAGAGKALRHMKNAGYH